MEQKTYPKELNEIIGALRTDPNNLEKRLQYNYNRIHQDTIEFSIDFVDKWNAHYYKLESPMNESNEDYCFFLKQMYLLFTNKYKFFDHSVLAKDIYSLVQAIEREKDDDTYKNKYFMILFGDVDVLRAICDFKDDSFK